MKMPLGRSGREGAREWGGAGGHERDGVKKCAGRVRAGTARHVCRRSGRAPSDEDAVRAKLHHERSVRRRGDATGCKVDHREPPVLAHLQGQLHWHPVL